MKRLCFFTTSFALLFAIAPLQATDYLIKAGRLIDGVHDTPFEKVMIRIAGNRIVAVSQDKLALREGEVLVDLSDYTVMPGLMDMHTHLTQQYSKKQYAERFFLNPADRALRAALFARRTLMAGFTTVRNLGDYDNVSVSLRNSINKGWATGPRIFTAGKSIATTGGHADHSSGARLSLRGDPGPKEGVINGPIEARKAVRQRYKDGADVIKLTVTGGVISLAKSAENPQFTMDELDAVMSTAKDYGFVVAVHAHGAVGMKRAIRAGVDSVEHGTYMDDEAMDLMLAHNTWYVPTITAGKWVAMKSEEDGFFPEIVRPKAAAVGPQIQDTFAKAIKRGIKIAFGTDAGVYPHGENGSEFGYMVEAGMQPMDAIISATMNAATLLRVDDQLGSVEVGKLADIVAVRDNPLADIATMKQVAFVMKDGKIEKQD